MTLRMADSIDPKALPAGMDAYAGYANGNWPDYTAIAAAHPGAHLLDLTVWLANLGDGIDDEAGDATDAQTVTYVAERLAAGKWRPVVYASISRMANVVALQTAAGHPRSSYRLLSAHYGAGKHICGPGTCKLGPACDGTQWIDWGAWDESLLLDTFFGALAPVTPAPVPAPTVYPGDNVTKTPISFAISGGKGWAPSPVPAASVINVVMSDENPEVVSRYDAVPHFDGAAAQTGPHSLNGSLNFSGPDGTWGAQVWSA